MLPLTFVTEYENTKNCRYLLLYKITNYLKHTILTHLYNKLVIHFLYLYNVTLYVNFI